MVSPTQQAPLLSVTVLNYNYAHYLPTCLDSILGQTFTDFEVILINDKSTDNSLEVIQPYLADPRVRLVDHVENKGFVASLIEGSDLSRGKYITVMSADDWSVDLTAFEKQIGVMEQDSEIAFVFTNYGFYESEQYCSQIANPAPTSYVKPGREVFRILATDRLIHHSGTVIRKTAYEAIDGYDPHLRYALDAQMWLGLCHVGKVAYIQDVLYAYRHHETNMSKKEAAVCRSINEMIQILDWSFGMLPWEERRGLDWLYKKAIRGAVTFYAIRYIFEGNYRLGWSFFWVAVKLRPLQTLFQRVTLSLILRTLLGYNYESIRQFKNSLRHKIHRQIATE